MEEQFPRRVTDSAGIAYIIMYYYTLFLFQTAVLANLRHRTIIVQKFPTESSGKDDLRLTVTPCVVGREFSGLGRNAWRSFLAPL